MREAEAPDYSLVEDLVHTGFLTQKMTAGDVPIVLKSMNNQELDMVGFRQPSSEAWRDRGAWMLAYSTFTFQGQNVLPDRNTLLPVLREGYSELPSYLFGQLLSSVYALNEKAARQASYVEPYSYGTGSRRQWSMLKDMRPCAREVTGVPGTESVGLNIHQKLWVYFNRFLDEEEEFEREWSIGRFVASAFNAKGVKKASRKAEREREEIDERRELIHRGKGEVTFDKDGRVELVADSDDELVDQIERTIEGEKDFHDRVIEEYETRIRRQRSEEVKKRRAARQRTYDDLRDAEHSSEEKAYDPDEVDEEVRSVDLRRAERLAEAPAREESAHHRDRTSERLKDWGIIPSEDEDPDEVFDHPLLNAYRRAEDDAKTPEFNEQVTPDGRAD